MATLTLEPPAYPRGRTGLDPVTMSYAQFLRGDGLPHNCFEYFDGKAHEMPAVDWRHELTRGWVQGVGMLWVRHHGWGEVFGEPMIIRTVRRDTDEERGRSPDLMFVSNEQMRQMEQHELAGPAALVVEIASPGTARLDHETKFQEYEAVSCLEYWMLDVGRQSFEPFALVNGTFVPRAAADEYGVFRSAAVDGLWLRPEWFWQRPEPLAVAREWGLVGEKG